MSSVMNSSRGSQRNESHLNMTYSKAPSEGLGGIHGQSEGHQRATEGHQRAIRGPSEGHQRAIRGPSEGSSAPSCT